MACYYYYLTVRARARGALKPACREGGSLSRHVMDWACPRQVLGAMAWCAPQCSKPHPLASAPPHRYGRAPLTSTTKPPRPLNTKPTMPCNPPSPPSTINIGAFSALRYPTLPVRKPDSRIYWIGQKKFSRPRYFDWTIIQDVYRNQIIPSS
jgi:hypothetical protein